MDRPSDQALRFAENLSVPSMQVIVIRGRTGSRVSRLVSRMNEGLLDYAVDVRSEEVVLRGIVNVNRGNTDATHDKLLKCKLRDLFYSFRSVVCLGGVR